MTRYLYNLSGTLFFLFGFTLFGAYFLYQNAIITPWAAWWLQVVDLSFLLCSALFAGTGLYMNVVGNRNNIMLGTCITLVLLTLWLFFAILNYWEILPSAFTDSVDQFLNG